MVKINVLIADKLNAHYESNENDTYNDSHYKKHSDSTINFESSTSSYFRLI